MCSALEAEKLLRGEIGCGRANVAIINDINVEGYLQDMFMIWGHVEANSLAAWGFRPSFLHQEELHVKPPAVKKPTDVNFPVIHHYRNVDFLTVSELENLGSKETVDPDGLFDSFFLVFLRDLSQKFSQRDMLPRAGMGCRDGIQHANICKHCNGSEPQVH